MSAATCDAHNTAARTDTDVRQLRPVRNPGAHAVLCSPLPAPARRRVAAAASGKTTEAVHLLRRGLTPREMLGRRLPFSLRVALVAIAVLGVAGGVALMINAGLGAGPGDVLISGAARHLGIQHGTASMLFSATMITAAVAFGRRPGIGTVVMMVTVGPVLNRLWGLTPHPTGLGEQIIQLLIGIGVLAGGVAAGLHAAFGSGSVELITDSISTRWGAAPPKVRLAIEAGFATVGLALGGIVGIGTVIVACAIGPAVALAVAAVGRILARWATPEQRRLPLDAQLHILRGVPRALAAHRKTASRPQRRQRPQLPGQVAPICHHRVR